MEFRHCHDYPSCIRDDWIQDICHICCHVSHSEPSLQTGPNTDSPSNAFICPCVYFFYPETAGRSLEEMDSIFAKCGSIFTVVKIAKEEPRRYGKNGELLIEYRQTEMARRRSSATATSMGGAMTKEKSRDEQEYV